MKSKLKTLVLAAAAAGVFGSGLAYAQSAETYRGDDEKEVHAIARAKIGLAEAITAAERETSGKAIEGQIEAKKDGRSYFEIEVYAGGKIVEVRIDPETGRVL
jgi:uncharacterized membrane protein YkoI